MITSVPLHLSCFVQ